MFVPLTREVSLIHVHVGDCLSCYPLHTWIQYCANHSLVYNGPFYRCICTYIVILDAKIPLSLGMNSYLRRRVCSKYDYQAHSTKYPGLWRTCVAHVSHPIISLNSTCKLSLIMQSLLTVHCARIDVCRWYVEHVAANVCLLCSIHTKWGVSWDFFPLTTSHPSNTV